MILGDEVLSQPCSEGSRRVQEPIRITQTCWRTEKIGQVRSYGSGKFKDTFFSLYEKGGLYNHLQ